jgi:Cu/Ag efflux pump CusA
VLVDAAIVMVENAYRRVSEAAHQDGTRAEQQR